MGKKTIFALNIYAMKKYLGLLLCLLVINACDDGDMKIDTFDFSAAQSKFCITNKLLYKVSGNEALILQINNDADAFPYRNVLGVRNIALNQYNKIIYRTFDSEVPESYFCSTIPPVSPTVTTEYASVAESGGIIEITTTLVPGTTTAPEAKYLHSIVLKNVTLTNAQGQTIIYEALNFGTYLTNSNVDLAFSNQTRQNCTGTDVYFKIIDSNVANNATQENLNKIIEITIPSALLPTLADDPKDIFINQTLGVKAKYRIYNGDVTPAEYCAQAPTLVNRMYEEWIAEDGVDEPDSSTTPDRGYFTVIRNEGSNNTVTYSITLKTIKFNRTFPIDPQGGIIGSFTTGAQNF